MGWLWSSRDDSPYRDLTPEVRRALQEASPAARHARSGEQVRRTPTESSHRAPDHFRAQAGFLSSDEKRPIVPEESLFQDGRYAHLWASYERPDQVETASANHDRLSAVVDSARQRQAEISRAALENCIFYQLAERECLESGSLKDRMTMCGKQSKASNRCYTMQSRFLKALGYAATETLDADNERIQMHAEKLYNEMLGREKAIAAAKSNGQPEPMFTPLMDVQTKSTGISARSEALTLLGADKLRQLDAKMSDMSQSEREVELSLIVADVKTSLGYSRKVNQYFDLEKEERAARREKGQETIGDTLKRLWGWAT